MNDCMMTTSVVQEWKKRKKGRSSARQKRAIKGRRTEAYSHLSAQTTCPPALPPSSGCHFSCHPPDPPASSQMPWTNSPSILMNVDRLPGLGDTSLQHRALRLFTTYSYFLDTIIEHSRPYVLSRNAQPTSHDLFNRQPQGQSRLEIKVMMSCQPLLVSGLQSLLVFYHTMLLVPKEIYIPG